MFGPTTYGYGMRVFRHPDLPAEVALQRGERVLARATTRESGLLLATDRALLLPGDRGEHRRLPWHAVAHVVWEDDSAALVVDELAESSGGNGQSELRTLRHRLGLAEPGFLPETVRERVMASIVVSEHIRLVGRRGVRIVARRIPGEAEPLWQLVFDAELDPTDPGLRQRAHEAVEQLRRQTLG
jgi:hypothetical protein